MKTIAKSADKSALGLSAVFVTLAFLCASYGESAAGTGDAVDASTGAGLL
jgi:hypothetical protein